MTTHRLASVSAAAFLVFAGCSTPRPVPAAAEAHVHGATAAGHDATAHGEDAMAAHMREMKQAMGEVRAILDRTQGVGDPAQQRAALDGIRAQLDVMEDSMARCKAKMHGNKES